MIAKPSNTVIPSIQNWVTLVQIAVVAIAYFGVSNFAISYNALPEGGTPV